MTGLKFGSIFTYPQMMTDQEQVILFFHDDDGIKKKLSVTISNEFLCQEDVRKHVVNTFASQIIKAYPDEDFYHIKNDMSELINGSPLVCNHSKKPNSINNLYTVFDINTPAQDSSVGKIAFNNLPAMHVIVNYPCDCFSNINNATNSVFDIVQHLNDKDKWTRHKIADWIDKLHDDGVIDAEFKTPEEKIKEPKPDNPCAEIVQVGWKNLGYTQEPLMIASFLDSLKFEEAKNALEQAKLLKEKEYGNKD